MGRYSDAQILRLGAITVVIMLLVMASAFNLSKLPMLQGETYYAILSGASGLEEGAMVQIAGIRSGEVQSIELRGAKVKVTFTVDSGVEFGTKTRASVEVLNLLGAKYLELQPAGPGTMQAGATIPMERTSAAYDIVGVLGDLTRTTKRIDTGSLRKALNVVADTIEASAPALKETLQGVARLSETISSRDKKLRSLLQSAQEVTQVLNARSKDIVKLMAKSDLVFKELQRRKEAVHTLLVNARKLARQLRGVVRDNRKQMQPALKEVNDLLTILNRQDKQIKATLDALAPYVRILSNIIGTGPWFDAYVVNLLGIPTGEFTEVERLP